MACRFTISLSCTACSKIFEGSEHAEEMIVRGHCTCPFEDLDQNTNLGCRRLLAAVDGICIVDAGCRAELHGVRAKSQRLHILGTCDHFAPLLRLPLLLRLLVPVKS